MAEFLIYSSSNALRLSPFSMTRTPNGRILSTVAESGVNVGVIYADDGAFDDSSYETFISLSSDDVSNQGLFTTAVTLDSSRIGVSYRKYPNNPRGSRFAYSDNNGNSWTADIEIYTASGIQGVGNCTVDNDGNVWAIQQDTALYPELMMSSDGTSFVSVESTTFVDVEKNICFYDHIWNRVVLLGGNNTGGAASYNVYYIDEDDMFSKAGVPRPPDTSSVYGALNGNEPRLGFTDTSGNKHLFYSLEHANGEDLMSYHFWPSDSSGSLDDAYVLPNSASYIAGGCDHDGRIRLVTVNQLSGEVWYYTSTKGHVYDDSAWTELRDHSAEGRTYIGVSMYVTPLSKTRPTPSQDEGHLLLEFSSGSLRYLAYSDELVYNLDALPETPTTSSDIIIGRKKSLGDGLSEDDQDYRKREEEDRRGTDIFGIINTLRDEQGNILLYEEPTTKANLERLNQFISVNTFRNDYDYDEASKSLDFQFTELKLKSVEDRINELFSLYGRLKSVIPNVGVRSHDSLIRVSSEVSGLEYINPEDYEAVSSELNDILNQLNEIDLKLRETNISNDSLELEIEAFNQQVRRLAEVVLNINNSEGYTADALIDMIVSKLNEILIDEEPPEPDPTPPITASKRDPLTVDVTVSSKIIVPRGFGQSLNLDVTFSILNGAGDTMATDIRTTPFSIENIPYTGSLSISTTDPRASKIYLNDTVIVENTSGIIPMSRRNNDIVIGVDII